MGHVEKSELPFPGQKVDGCCKSVPLGPGSQFVISLLKVYMLVYQSNAVLLPTGERVPLSGIRIESSDDGFGWSLSASGPVDLVDK